MTQAMSAKYLLSAFILTWLLVGCQVIAPLPATAEPTPVASPTSAGADSTPAAAQPVAPESPLSTQEIIDFITTTVEPRLHDAYPSPDGKWRVEVVIYDCTQVGEANEGGPVENSYEQLTLIKLQDGARQQVDQQLINCGGLGAYGLEGRNWSEDSRYFYYTDARTGVPDGAGDWTRRVLRLEVASMAVENVTN